MYGENFGDDSSLVTITTQQQKLQETQQITFCNDVVVLQADSLFVCTVVPWYVFCELFFENCFLFETLFNLFIGTAALKWMQ